MDNSGFDYNALRGIKSKFSMSQTVSDESQAKDILNDTGQATYTEPKNQFDTQRKFLQVCPVEET